MDLYIKKRTLHILLTVLLLLAASVTVVAAQQQQHLKQSAQTASSSAQTGGYPVPPLYGCLQVGEGTNKSCSSKLLDINLKVTLDGENAEGKTVFYNQALNAVLTATNVADLPVKIKALTVIGKALNAKYTVDFTPAKQNFTVNPKQSVTLSGATHTFNNPDPGGPWEITSTIVTDDGQKVTDVQAVNVNVNTSCLALLRTKFTPQQLATLKTTCKTSTSAPECGEYCQLVAKGTCK
jgi:hypothetical protein